MRIKELCYLFTDGDWIETKDQSDEGIRLIQTGNIGEGVFLEKINKERYITEGTFKRLNCTEVFPEDILISRLPEPVGRGCIIPNKTERMITAVDCTICRLKNNLIDNQYFCYYINSPAYYKQLNQNVTGTTRKRISRKNLGNVEIKLPDKTRQLEIVSHLNIISSILNNKRKELQLLNDLTKARFVEMFGNRWSNNKHWPVKTLGESTEFFNGKAHEQVVDDNGEYILVTSRCIASNLSDYRRTNTLLFPLRTGDICMVMSDVPNGKALAKCFLIDKDNLYTLNQRICCFRNYSLNKTFFLHLLNRHEYLLSFNDGDSQTNLRKGDLLNCPIINPPITLQEEFETFVKQIDKSKVAVQKSLEQTQLLFDSLMQQYFG